MFPIFVIGPHHKVDSWSMYIKLEYPHTLSAFLALEAVSYILASFSWVLDQTILYFKGAKMTME